MKMLLYLKLECYSCYEDVAISKARVLLLL